MSYFLPDKVYNVLKWVCLILLPALATAVGALGAAFDWSLTEVCVGGITTLTTVLGGIIGVSAATAKSDGDES